MVAISHFITQEGAIVSTEEARRRGLPIVCLLEWGAVVQALRRSEIGNMNVRGECPRNLGAGMAPPEIPPPTLRKGDSQLMGYEADRLKRWILENSEYSTNKFRARAEIEFGLNEEKWKIVDKRTKN